MKATAFGLLGGTVIAFAFWSIVGRGMPAVADSSVYQPSGDLIAMSTTIEHDRQSIQQITVIDPRARAMSVYNIDAKSGAIALKSVRNLEFDLQMKAYNTANPLPSEIGRNGATSVINHIRVTETVVSRWENSYGQPATDN